MINKYPDYQIINLDLLTYAGDIRNLNDISDNDNYQFVQGNICDSGLLETLFEKYDIDTIINFAAETHVDRSITNPNIFVETNVMGTGELLNAANKYNIDRFIQISTDEVYGALGQKGRFTEESLLAPNSPYSASKAGADMLVRSYYKTYGLQVIITRCTNNYGSYQNTEKLIPLIITRALKDKELPVYGDGLQIRDWLHVQDHCLAIDKILHNGEIGEIYNIGANNEQTNIDLIKTILKYLGKPDSLIRHVKDRLGHDRRYALDTSKIKEELSWVPKYSFEKGLKETINWYLSNEYFD